MLLHDRQQELVEGILKDFEGDMARIIAEIEKLLNRYLLSNPMSATNALEFDVAFQRILTEAGYYDLVNKMVDSDYDNLFGLISDGFAAGGLATKYTTDDLKRVMALKALQSNQFAVVGSTAGTALRDNLFKYALSNYTVEDMTSQLIEDFKGTNLVKHSKTLANTAIKEFQESMIDISAEGLDGVVYIYVGVRDKKNRDFCRCILDKKHYYTDKDDKNKMQYAPERRFNCRHRWRPVTEEYAKANGYTPSKKADCV